MSKRKTTPFYQYEATYIRCPTGVYMLVGTVPAYLSELLFKDEATTIEARDEAKNVLKIGASAASKKFSDAYYSGERLVK